MTWLFLAGWLGRSLVARGGDRRGGRVADIVVALAFAVTLAVGVNRLTHREVYTLDEQQYVYVWVYRGGAERTEVPFTLYEDQAAIAVGGIVAQCLAPGTTLELLRDGKVLARWPQEGGG